jgi:flagellar biosynthetic protein FliQ
MRPEYFVNLFQEGLYTVLIMAGAILLPGLGIGLLVAIFQAATSINEQTLSFLPRLMVTLMTMGFLGHWLVRVLMEFMLEVVSRIPVILG